MESPDPDISSSPKRPEDDDANDDGEASASPRKPRESLCTEGSTNSEEPAEYVALDALRHLPPGLAQRMMRSMQLSAQRLERTERLVLDLQEQVSNSCGASCASTAAPETSRSQYQKSAMASSSDTQGPIIPLLCGISIALVAYGFACAIFPSRASAPLHSAELPQVLHKELPSFHRSVKRRKSFNWNGILSRLHQNWSSCRSSEQSLQNELAYYRSDRANASTRKCRARKSVESRKARQARMSSDALTSINTQQERIAKHEAERAVLLAERDGCLSCLQTYGAFEGCVELSEVAKTSKAVWNATEP